MWILTKLRSWSSIRSSRQDRLLAEARGLATGILPQSEVVGRAREVPGHVGQVDGAKRWDSWRWLIRTHRMAQEQALRLDNCCKLVRRAVAMRLEDDSGNSFHESLFQCFAGPLELDREEPSSLDELLSVLEERKSSWRGLAEDVQKVRPPVFVSHAFLRLSDSTA